MGRHGNVDLRLGQDLPDIVRLSKTWKHQIIVREFVVHAQKATAAVFVQRHEADIVVVIAELFRLRGGGLALTLLSPPKVGRRHRSQREV